MKIEVGQTLRDKQASIIYDLLWDTILSKTPTEVDQYVDDLDDTKDLLKFVLKSLVIFINEKRDKLEGE